MIERLLNLFGWTRTEGKMIAIAWLVVALVLLLGIGRFPWEV